MWAYILIGIVAVILLFAIIVSIQPALFRIVRSATMTAPPARVFEQVNDFHNWKAWSPWAKIDPAMKETYEGPPAGVGAKYSWDGNKQVGAGRMTITDSKPSSDIRILLEFLRPFATTNSVHFAFKPQGSQTGVEWIMEGKKNFISKAFCMFFNMDKMVGADFEKGLAQMKAIVETTG